MASILSISADVNGDGIPDLIIANVLSDSINQLRGTGTCSFVNGDDIFLAADPLAVSSPT